MEQHQTVSRIQAVIDECVPLLKALAKGRYAVSIGGSHGKGTFDERSDVDFRLFCDEIAGAPKYWETDAWKTFTQVVARWRAQGIDLVHDMLQVLFALNETYYVGDGNNLHYVEAFAIQPPAFAKRVNDILYPPHTEDVFATQYHAIVELIDDVVALAA